MDAITAVSMYLYIPEPDRLAYAMTFGVLVATLVYIVVTCLALRGPR